VTFADIGVWLLKNATVNSTAALFWCATLQGRVARHHDFRHPQPKHLLYVTHSWHRLMPAEFCLG